jgi:glutamate/tyrosine decarboxylase-like PLP-dependent enzyme
MLQRIAEVPLSTVCFRVAGGGAPEDDDARTAAVVDHLNRSGVAFVMTTVLDDRTVIRFPIGNLKTTDERLDETLNALDEAITHAM